MKNEKILCVDEKYLKNYYYRNELQTISLEFITQIIVKCGNFYDRQPTEKDISLKQIIPYIIVTQGMNYFLMYRTNKQTETRLHNLYSIGVGGHLNNEDGGSIGEVITKGMFRELYEEIDVNYVSIPRFLGLLYSDANEVGLHHMGLVFQIMLPEWVTLEIREKENMNGEWLSIGKLKERYDSMENWTKMVYDYLDKKL